MKKNIKLLLIITIGINLFFYFDNVFASELPMPDNLVLLSNDFLNEKIIDEDGDYTYKYDGSYIIGSHLFTPNVGEEYDKLLNTSHEYFDGILKTSHIMYASLTIGNNSLFSFVPTLEDMIVYYVDGNKLTNAYTGEEILNDSFQMPYRFIKYTNLIENENDYYVHDGKKEVPILTYRSYDNYDISSHAIIDFNLKNINKEDIVQIAFSFSKDGGYLEIDNTHSSSIEYDFEYNQDVYLKARVCSLYEKTNDEYDKDIYSCGDWSNIININELPEYPPYNSNIEKDEDGNVVNTLEFGYINDDISDYYSGIEIYTSNVSDKYGYKLYKDIDFSDYDEKDIKIVLEKNKDYCFFKIRSYYFNYEEKIYGNFSNPDVILNISKTIDFTPSVYYDEEHLMYDFDEEYIPKYFELYEVNYKNDEPVLINDVILRKYLEDGYDISSPDFAVLRGIVLNEDGTGYYTNYTDPIKISNRHLVKFDLNGYLNTTLDSIVVTQEGKYGELPIITKYGTTFDGWYTEKTGGTKVTKDSIVKTDKDEILYAHWTDNTYVVTFKNGDVEYKKENIVYNNIVTKPSNPTQVGKVFVEWQLDGKKYDFTTKITKDITLEAVFRNIIKYTITFNTNGGSTVASQTIEEGNKVVKPTNPTKRGYIFDGWDWDFSKVVTKDITINAKWKNNISCTVDYVSEGEINVPSRKLTFKEGSNIVTDIKSLLDKDGYAINSKKLDNSFIINITKIKDIASVKFDDGTIASVTCNSPL